MEVLVVEAQRMEEATRAGEEGYTIAAGSG